MIDVEGTTDSILPLTSVKTITLGPPSSILAEDSKMTSGIRTSTVVDSGLLSSGQLDSLHLAVAVVQSTHSIITEILRRFGTNILRYIGPENNWNGTPEFDAILQDYLTDRAISTLVADFKSENMVTMTQLLFANNDVSVYEKITDDGTEIRAVPHYFTFPIDTRNPPHLAYFSLSFIQEDIDFSDLKTSVKNDIVFNNSLLSSVTYFYQLINGKYWAGPVIKEGNTYKTDNEEGAPLRVRQTRNIKIQDFRSREQIENVSIMDDFADEQATIANINFGISPKIRELDPRFTKDLPYISDAFLSYEPRKRAKFMFMINFEDLIFGNSTYRNLWKTSYTNIRADILSRSRIEQIKVFREKVRESVGSNSLGTSERYVPEEGEIPFFVGSSAKASLREEDGFSVPPFVRVYSVTDDSFDESARAQYRYYVEVSAHDGSKDFLREKIEALQNFSRTVKNYFLKILDSTIRKSEHGLRARGAAAELSQVTSRSSGYDPVYNNLTPDFAAQMRAQYWDEIVQGKAVFLEMIDIFSQPDLRVPTGIDLAAINNFITLLLEPATTNPDNINSFLNLLNDVISKMVDVVGQRTGTSSDANSESVYQATSGKSDIFIKKYFNTTFDLAEHDIGGYSYLSSNTTNIVNNSFGLRVESGDVFRNRIQLETLKYYTSSRPNIRLLRGTPRVSYRRNQLGYLSPSHVVVGDYTKPYSTVRVLDSQTEGALKERVLKVVESRLLANRVFYSKTGFSFPYTGGFAALVSSMQEDEPSFSANYIQYFLAQTFGLTSELETLSSGDQNKDPTLDLEDKADEESQDPPKAGNEFSLSLAATAPSSLYDSLIRQEFLIDSSKESNFGSTDTAISVIEGLSGEQIADLPNQMAAFLMTNAGSAEDGPGGGGVKFNNSSGADMIRDGRYSSTTTFNYRLLTRVEYLKGFAIPALGGSPQVSSPQWEILDETAYSELRGKKVLCRLVKYDVPLDSLRSLSRPPSLDMRIYDEHFILIPEGSGHRGASRASRNDRKRELKITEGLSSLFANAPEFGTTSKDTKQSHPPMSAALEVIDQMLSIKLAIKLERRWKRIKTTEQAAAAYVEALTSAKKEAQKGSLRRSTFREIEQFRRFFNDNSSQEDFAQLVEKLDKIVREDD